MIQVQSIQEWRKISKENKNKKIGLVPTMGYLHQGHVSLFEQAKQEVDLVVASIFVNPLQFGVNEDYSTYPRDLNRDAALAEQAGVDYLFVPDVAEMYPTPILTQVSVKNITESMCGRSRPGHFDGVATVVAKLFNIIQPEIAFFGQKDAQQIAVIQQMVSDLNMPVQIRPCPTLREEDGLAMSSRNVYLSAEERSQAVILYHSLQLAVECIKHGERCTERLKKTMADKISSQPLAIIDYIEIRQFPSLEFKEKLEGKSLIALAIKFGKTRLIDNMIVEV
jgi:pantoate--beta-alanine ligase